MCGGSFPLATSNYHPWFWGSPAERREPRGGFTIPIHPQGRDNAPWGTGICSFAWWSDPDAVVRHVHGTVNVRLESEKKIADAAVTKCKTARR